MQLDSKPPVGDMASYLRTEGRFQTLERQNPDRFRTLVASAQREAATRYALYQHLAAFAGGSGARQE